MTPLLPPLLVSLALGATLPKGTTRIKELTDVVGVRENALYGYGLVVGLPGTGDTERVLFTSQSISGMLGRLGIRIDPKDVRARNVAAVMVTARLPPFARPGTKIDVAVSSMGNARSIAGGVLLVTPLLAGDGALYAVAQGPVQVAGFDAGSFGSSLRRNTPTAGRIPDGATVERATDHALAGSRFTLALRHPDLTTANRIAAAIVSWLGPGTARALDGAAVELVAPAAMTGNPVDFLSQVEMLLVDADRRARVVVSDRTGTVVAGEGVRLRPVAIAHGSLQIRVQRDPRVSQPAPFGAGNTATTTQDATTAGEEGAGVVALPATSTIEDLAKALNLLGAGPRDLVAVLEAMKAAGAFDADLEVLQ